MKQSEKPNIILIVMDCVRADHMSCYGYHRRTTPYLDKLASKGVLYEHAIAPTTWTLPSHWSMFTGLFLSRHSVWNRNLALSPQYQTIAQILGSEGYETAAFSNNPHVGVTNGFGRGFDVFEELFRIREQNTLPNLAMRVINKVLLDVLKLKYDGAYRTNRTIKKWLANRPYPQRPFFFFVNYMDVHTPYQPPWPYNSRFMDGDVKSARKNVMADFMKSAGGKTRKRRLSEWEVATDEALYDAELAFLDSQLNSLLSDMERRGYLDNSLVIITSDHGHSLGEHGLIGHAARWLYDNQVRVPLILYSPGILPAGLRVSQQVQLVDIVPTILAVLGRKQGSWAHPLQGQSMLPEDLNGSGRPFSVIQAHYWVEDQTGIDRGLNAIRTDDYKYISTPDGLDELYNLKDDPQESFNLIGQEPAKADELKTYLQEWLAAQGAFEEGDQAYAALEVELDVEVEDRLRALGYIE